jgi:cellobiose phosphorylase
MTAGFLWHAIHRQHVESGLTASVVNFIPVNEDTVELMQVTLTNEGVEPLELVPTAAIPMFGRSADNLRDHRHVTALLHRTVCHQYGVLVKPTMSLMRAVIKLTRLFTLFWAQMRRQPATGLYAAG